MGDSTETMMIANHAISSPLDSFFHCQLNSVSKIQSMSDGWN